MTLACILGREPHLSVAELHAVLGDAGDWQRAELSATALVVPVAIGEGASDSRRIEDEPNSSVHALMERLGGTIKIGEIWRTVTRGKTSGVDRKTPDVEERVHEAIGKYILDQTTGDRKIHFGYSVYDFGAGMQRTAIIRQSLVRGAATQKSWLQNHGRTVRWVTSREPTLSSVVVQQNSLLPERNGVEVLVLVGADRILLARTLAVQPFAAWSRRDYGRPARSMVRGMLPPKLARIMVNLARIPAGGVVLDPFCGTGTVLTEAIALGCRAIGSDRDPEAIAATRANLTWSSQHRMIPHPASPRLLTLPIERLSAAIAPASVAAIITEPYLGPIRGMSDAQSSIKGTIAELQELYITAFRAFARVLKLGGRVVFVVPAFRTPHGEHAVDIMDDVARFGFRRINPFPTPLRDHPVLRGEEELPYARPDQRVGRRILMFAYGPTT